VLRSIARVTNNTGGYQSNCVPGGSCYYVWQGILDLSADAVAAGTPAVLFQSGSDPTFYKAVATSVVGSGHLYSFKLDNHTVSEGMSTTSLMRTRIQVAPVLEMKDGSRLFDHNRNPGDYDNYVLIDSNGWSVQDDVSICRAWRPARPSASSRTGLACSTAPSSPAASSRSTTTCPGCRNA